MAGEEVVDESGVREEGNVAALRVKVRIGYFLQIFLGVWVGKIDEFVEWCAFHGHLMLALLGVRPA